MANENEVDAVSMTQPQLTSKEKFIASVYPYAERSSNILKDQGINVDPRSIVSQWAHETGYGTNTGAKNNNLAGMYAYPSSPYGINGKDYASLDDFVIDYTNTLANQRYSGINNTGDDVTAFASALKAGGYATDPNYAYAGSWIEAFNIATDLGLKSTSANGSTDPKWYQLYRYDQNGNKIVVSWSDFFLGKTIEAVPTEDGSTQYSIIDNTYNSVNEANGGTTYGQTPLIETPDNWMDIVKLGIFQVMILVLVVLFLYASLIRGSGVEKTAGRIGKAVASGGVSEVVG